MARTITSIKVLVGYPDDVSDERAILDEVVEELNRTWSHSLGIQIELVDWKTHAWPNVGSDAQAVVNDEIGRDYDMFLGIMWTKFGEPTPRADSGTAEEFERALERFKQDPNQIRIMFYFKDAPPQSLKDIDPAHLTSIREFKKRVSDAGGLYAGFGDSKQFSSAVRFHLSKQVQEYGKTWGVDDPESNSAQQTATITPAADAETSPEADNDEGFLDLIEQFEAEFNNVNEILERMNRGMVAMREGVQEKSAELSELNRTNAPAKQRKRVLNDVAETLDSYSAELEADVPLMSNSYTRAMDAMTRAVSIWTEDSFGGQEEAVKGYDHLQTLLDALNEYLPTMRSLRDQTATMPRLTSDFNRSKRRMASALDAVVRETEHEIELAQQLKSHFGQALQRNDKGDSRKAS